MYDTFIIGQISEDINVSSDGAVQHEMGGAVLHGGYSVSGVGRKVAVLPKCNLWQIDPKQAYSKAENVEVIPLDSPSCTSIRHVYQSAVKEQRRSTVIGRIEPYKVSEIPDIDASVYHIAGLMRGDVGNDIIDLAHSKAKVALDAQGIVRCEIAGEIVFKDWEDKLEYLPKIQYLQADALEAMVLTGCEIRADAARLLHSWGVSEVMITHHSKVLVFDGTSVVTCPLKPRNLTGRSGRGDTCFSVYVAERQHSSVEQALHFAAATTSLKMETPGPFTQTRQDVDNYCKEWYDLP